MNRREKASDLHNAKGGPMRKKRDFLSATRSIRPSIDNEQLILWMRKMNAQEDRHVLGT
jgi:hypothetical protein